MIPQSSPEHGWIIRGKICGNVECGPDLDRVRTIDMGDLPQYEIIWDSF